MEHFFSPNSGGDLHSDAHQSQVIGGGADVDHTQIIGGIQSNYWGEFIPPSPRVSAPLIKNKKQRLKITSQIPKKFLFDFSFGCS